MTARTGNRLDRVFVRASTNTRRKHRAQQVRGERRTDWAAEFGVRVYRRA